LATVDGQAETENNFSSEGQLQKNSRQAAVFSILAQTSL